MNITYKVVHYESLERLEQTINRMLKEGYSLVGGISYMRTLASHHYSTSGSYGNYGGQYNDYYTQALIKRERLSFNKWLGIIFSGLFNKKAS